MGSPKAARRPVALYIALAMLLLCAVAFQTRVTVDVASAQNAPRLPLYPHTASRVVATVYPEAFKAGIRRGDELVAVEGRPFSGVSVLTRAVVARQPGDTVTLSLRRGGETIQAVVRLAATALPITRLEAELLRIVMYVVMPWFCLLLGFWVTAIRPRDPQAWLLLALMLSFPHIMWIDLLHWGDFARVGGLLYQQIMRGTLPAMMLLFGLYFAERARLDERWPWLKWLLLVPLAVATVTGAVAALLVSENLALAAVVVPLVQPLAPVLSAILFTTIGCFFALLGYKSGTAQNPDAKRRLRMLLWGTQTAMTPMFILIVWSLSSNKQIIDLVPGWVLTAALLLMFLFPLTMAYVIVVHRALDVRVVVRQGIQYALARGGAQVLMVALGTLILFASISFALDSGANRPRQILLIGAGVLLLMLLQRARVALAHWIDRRFFRQAYDAERILTELSESVRTMVDRRPLLETVARRISDSLFVPRVALLLRENGHYSPAYAHGYSDAPAVRFDAACGTVRQLDRTREPARVYLDDESSWINRSADVTERERSMLSTLDAQLILPLAVNEKLLGFISLGQKRSEEPYSASDVRLLRSVAVQTGLALENSRLTAAVAAEAAQRERINREIEIAREVQERLFPQKMPQVDGIDCAGACRPALGVGGDYYDFLNLPDGLLRIVIADIAGKGIAAALLMASLQASVRGQMLNADMPLAAIVSHLNRLLYESSATSRYATLFYAQLDPKSRRLDYVNAGHNPPLVLRRRGAELEVTRLEEGGSVVGLLPVSRYTQGSVALCSGDQLIAFTDGISEAMNPADEEWGEERLIEAARRSWDLPAAGKIPFLMREADAFCNGAKQHDDMTLVVLRVL